MCALRSACCSWSTACTACCSRSSRRCAQPSPPIGAIGFVNGVLGGLTGLAGPIVVIWCQLTGVPRHAQRAIFQPVILAVFAMTALGLGIGGAITAEVVKLFALGAGARCRPESGSGCISMAGSTKPGFRRVILVMLLLSGPGAAGAGLAVTRRPGVGDACLQACSSLRDRASLWSAHAGVVQW